MGSTLSSRFNLVGHVEVNADGREGHQVACLGPRFQIEFDVSFEPEWEEDCALGGFLVSVRVLIADCISPAASWLCVLLYSCHCRRCRVGRLGGAVVPAPRTLPLLLELPREGGTEQGWPCM